MLLVSFIFKLKVTRQKLELRQKKRRREGKFSIPSELLYFNRICVEFICCNSLYVIPLCFYCIGRGKIFRLVEKKSDNFIIFFVREISSAKVTCTDKHSRSIDRFLLLALTNRTLAPRFLTDFDDVEIISCPLISTCFASRRGLLYRARCRPQEEASNKRRWRRRRRSRRRKSTEYVCEAKF